MRQIVVILVLIQISVAAAILITNIFQLREMRKNGRRNNARST